GYVLKPGQYLVPRNTDLITLISFAGGPREGANLKKVRIIREEPALLTNGHAENDSDGSNWQSQRIPILTVSIDDHIKEGKRGVLPALRAGDTVIIPESGGSKFQKFSGFNSLLSIIAATATVALIVERLSR
ncbi:MAG: SLBB domain-containing protein, partial [bacterium]